MKANKRSAKKTNQVTAAQSRGLVERAKSVLKPVLVGAAAAAAVITGKKSQEDDEPSKSVGYVDDRSSETDTSGEAVAPNPQQLTNGVLIDRRR